MLICFWYLLFFYCNVYLSHTFYSPFMWQDFYEKIYFYFFLSQTFIVISNLKKRNITSFIILSKIFTRLSLAWHPCLFSIFFIIEIIIISMVSMIRISATDWLISCVSLYIFNDQCLLFPFYTVDCLSLSFRFGSTVCQNSAMNRMPRAEFIVDCGDRPDIAGATAKVWWIKRK